MPHHEESPEKPQYNMATPPISRQPPPPHFAKPPFSSKNFQTPPHFHQFQESRPPPLYKGVGLNYVRTTTGMQSGPDAFDKSRFITI